MKQKVIDQLNRQLKNRTAVVINAQKYAAGRLISNLKRIKENLVLVVNGDKAIIKGTPSRIVEKYAKRINSGNKIHGPFISCDFRFFLKRMVKSMRVKKDVLFLNQSEKSLFNITQYCNVIKKKEIYGPHQTITELMYALKKNKNV